jgi:hypothetical protein
MNVPTITTVCKMVAGPHACCYNNATSFLLFSGCFSGGQNDITTVPARPFSNNETYIPTVPSS